MPYQGRFKARKVTGHTCGHMAMFSLRLFRAYWLKARDQASWKAIPAPYLKAFKAGSRWNQCAWVFPNLDLGTCNLIQFVLQAVLLGNRCHRHKCLKSKRFQLPFLKTNSFVFQPLDKVRFRMLVWKERGRTNLLWTVKEGRMGDEIFFKKIQNVYFFFQFFLNQFLQCGFIFWFQELWLPQKSVSQTWINNSQPNENDFWLSVLPFISDSTDNQKLRMKVVSDSPTTENKTKENAACQLRSRGKSVLKLGIKHSCSNFQW